MSENILKNNQDLLHSMAKALLKYETIDSKDIDRLLNGKNIIRRGTLTKSRKKKKILSINSKSPQINSINSAKYMEK